MPERVETLMSAPTPEPFHAAMDDLPERVVPERMDALKVVVRGNWDYFA